MTLKPQAEEAPSAADKSLRKAVIALLLLLPAPTIGTAASLIIWPEIPLAKALFVATKLWTAALPLVWLLLIDRQPISWSPPRKGGFGLATVSGLVIAGVILGAYYATLKLGLIDPQSISQRASQTGLDQLGFYILGAVYWITLNSLMEEYVWRWFVFRKFEVLVPGKVAVVTTSFAFTIHHIVALAAQFDWTVTLLGSLGVFLGGLAWSWIYLRYQSVWPCYLSHAIVDAPIFWVGYDLIFRRGN